MIVLKKLYDYFVSIFFLICYAIYNRANLANLFKSNSSFIGLEGWMSLALDKKYQNKLNNILESVSVRARHVVNNQFCGSHDTTIVGNQPLSLNSLCTSDELSELRKIVNQIFIENEAIGKYLGVNLNRLDIELTLLSNTSSGTEAKKRGSQNYHRDIYHSFFRGCKIFYPFIYSEEEQFGPFSFIPLSKIGSNETPAKLGYSKDSIKERRFDLHPLIKRNIPNSIIIKKRELVALDTYNCFHAGGYITAPDFMRLIFQVVISPTQTPNKFRDIASGHFTRFFYFSVVRARNLLRRSVR